VILRVKDYAALMCESQTSIRRQLNAGLCRVQPCMTRPYRWRKSDVEAFLAGVRLPDDRKFHRQLIEARTA
jgi:hypothetical protein